MLAAGSVGRRSGKMRSAEDILIDDAGKVLPVAALALRFGRRKADDILIEHAVCELGYIHAATRSEGMMVELRAAAFSLVTLIGALFAITDRKPSHILLTIFWEEGRRTSENLCQPRRFRGARRDAGSISIGHSLQRIWLNPRESPGSSSGPQDNPGS